MSNESQIPAMSIARREARIVAMAIDLVILAFSAATFIAIGAFTILLQTNWLEVDPNRSELLVSIVISGLWILFPIIYFTVGACYVGTIGSRCIGIEVRTFHSSDQIGDKPKIIRGTLRSILLCSSIAGLGLGSLLMIFHPMGLPFHEFATRTVSIERLQFLSDSTDAHRNEP